MDELKTIIDLNARGSTRIRAKAFWMMDNLDKMSVAREANGKRYITKYRVGEVIRDRIVIDIDSHNEANLHNTLHYLKGLYSSDFEVRKTSNGYHIIQKQKYDNREEWLYNACRLLFPDMPKEWQGSYLKKVNNLFDKLKKEREGKDFTKIELQALAKEFPKRFKEAGLYKVPAGIEFDVLHAVNALIREKYVLRISLKNKNDKIEVIT